MAGSETQCSWSGHGEKPPRSPRSELNQNLGTGQNVYTWAIVVFGCSRSQQESGHWIKSLMSVNFPKMESVVSV